MITRNFNLYLNAGHSVPLVINVNQYDSGEQWVFTLYNSDGTQYTPSTGAIVGIKSDGLGIINSGSVVDGKVVISETSQMTAAAGKAVFELLIDSQTHGTANFEVLVEEKPGNNADLSESDISMLQGVTDILPNNTGTTGQVLTKTANGTNWADPTGGSSIAVDTDVSLTSTNPVQNKVITDYVEDFFTLEELEQLIPAVGQGTSVERSAVRISRNGLDALFGQLSVCVPKVDSSTFLIDVDNIPVDSTVTTGGTNPVNSTAVIAYINSLDASNTSY